MTEGYAPYMFYVYHQLYDESGKPIEGAYANLNDDDEINSEDLYRYHSPAPTIFLDSALLCGIKNGIWARAYVPTSAIMYTTACR